MTDQDFSGDYDIAVIGGGLVGSVLALALANSDRRVVLIDAGPLSVATESDSSTPKVVRTTAIAAGSVAILEALVPQLRIDAMGCPIQRVHVSQKGYFGSTRISAEEEGVSALGYVVENQVLQETLFDALAEAPLITRAAPVKVTNVERNDFSVIVTSDHGVISAPWLIGVDGNHSVVRKFCEISQTATDYDQCAVVTTVQAELPHQQTAFERFTPQGPMAMLPLDTHTLSLIFTVDSDEVTSVLASTDTEFLQRVQQTFGYRLGLLSEPGTRQAFPLTLQESDSQGMDRVVLLGNAARSLHPVAGQGFNLAVRDVGKLLELAAAENAEHDIPALLSSFHKQRERDQRATRNLTDFLAKTFRGYNPVLSHLRGLGLIGLDVLPAARRRFSRQAMGLAVSLPDIQYPH